MHILSPRRRRGWTARALGLAAAVAVAGALGACGDDSTEAVEKAAASQDEQATSGLLQYARCMRGQGVDYPDPGPDGAVHLPGPLGPQGEVAHKACEKHLPPRPRRTPAQQKATADAMLVLTKCLRKHGADVSDPVTDPDGDVSISGSTVPPAAVRACGELYDKAGLPRPSL